MDKYARVADILCPAHREAAETYWSARGDLTEQLNDCSRCKQSFRTFCSATGITRFRQFPDLEGEVFLELVAFHEAGHAVVGVLTGHPLLEVAISPKPNSREQGYVRWADYELPVHSHLAMLAAGQEATSLWLADADLDTPANRVDARYVGWRDNADATHWTQKYCLPEGSGHPLARTLLATHWDAVTEFASWLHDHHQVEGRNVHEYLRHRVAPR